MAVPPGAVMTFYVSFVQTAMSGIGHLTVYGRRYTQL